MTHFYSTHRFFSFFLTRNDNVLYSQMSIRVFSLLDSSVSGDGNMSLSSTLTVVQPFCLILRSVFIWGWQGWERPGIDIGSRSRNSQDTSLDDAPFYKTGFHNSVCIECLFYTLLGNQSIVSVIFGPEQLFPIGYHIERWHPPS